MTNSPAQRVKTIGHEIAHALLHEKFDDRAVAELEAESTAYVVCQALGLDTSDYSFGYVATWAGGGEQAIAGLKASASASRRAQRPSCGPSSPQPGTRQRKPPSLPYLVAATTRAAT